MALYFSGLRAKWIVIGAVHKAHATAHATYDNRAEQLFVALYGSVQRMQCKIISFCGQVIPEVVPHVSETAELSINYGGHSVSNGDELAPSQTAEEPEVVIKGSNTYTLLWWCAAAVM